MRYYTLFVIDLASRRVHIVGSAPYPNDRFMRQAGRTLTMADDGLLRTHRILICDRDRKWSREVHYHHERNHQEPGNRLIEGVAPIATMAGSGGVHDLVAFRITTNRPREAAPTNANQLD